MGKGSVLLFGSLVLLLASSVTARAEPILYTTSGQIRLGTGEYETFSGSFVLSDPATTSFDLSDSRGDQLDLYSISSFTLASTSYSLTGHGSIAVFWALFRDPPIHINLVDSVIELTTSAGLLETVFNFPVWNGNPGAQPLGFTNLTEPIGPPGNRSGHILNMSAVRADTSARVPEPSTLLLYAVGAVGVTALRRRRKSQQAR